MFVILGFIFMIVFFIDLRSYLFDYQVGREDFSSMGALVYAIHAQEPINHIGIILSLAFAIGCFIVASQPVQTVSSFWQKVLDRQIIRQQNSPIS